MHDGIAAADKGNFTRLEYRCLHIDTHLVIVVYCQCEQSIERLYYDAVLVGQALISDIFSEAAGAVTTMLNFPSVGIEDTIAEIDICLCGRLKYQ